MVKNVFCFNWPCWVEICFIILHTQHCNSLLSVRRISWLYLVWHHFRKRDHNHCVNLLPADYYVPICSSGQQPWQLWNNLPVKLTNYFSATEDKRINSHHLTEQEPNAPDISKLPLNGIFFWMQIMTKVCSVMNWSFYQFFHGKQFVLECTMFVPMDFYERSHLRFHMKPPPHLPLVRDKDGRLINI